MSELYRYGRSRDGDGRVNKKHGQVRLSTLRLIYGPRFGEGMPDSSKLKHVLFALQPPSLMRLYKDHDDGLLDLKVAVAASRKGTQAGTGAG